MSQTKERHTEEEDVTWSISSMEAVSLHLSQGNPILTPIFTDCHDDVSYLPSSSLHGDLKMCARGCLKSTSDVIPQKLYI